MANILNLRTTKYLIPENWKNLSPEIMDVIQDVVSLQAALGLFPSGTTAERLALTPTAPLIFQDTTLQTTFVYNPSTGWSPFSA